jgi:hypothetical protein
MKKVLGLAVLCLSLSAFAQNSPVLLGTWKGVGHTAVAGSGTFHPPEAGKDSNQRFRNVEYVLVIDREEGRNFSGYLTATSKKDSTDTNYKPTILGTFGKDMKNGVWVSPNGTATFKLVDPKNLEVCHTHTTPQQRVASCFELVKQ